MKALRKLVQRALRSRGYVLRRTDGYEERLEPVRHAWLSQLGVRTVLDVGAGNGGFAQKAVGWFPGARFYCFEPLESQLAGLRERFGSDPRFVLVPAALSSRSGPCRFLRNEYAGASSLLPMAEAHRTAYPYTARVQETLVECSTLDDFLAGHALDPAIFLKLDVQGAELLVLRGAARTLAQACAVYLEVSFLPLYLGQPLFEDVLRFLGEAGFALAGVENVSQSLVDGSFLQADALFLRRGLIDR